MKKFFKNLFCSKKNKCITIDPTNPSESQISDVKEPINNILPEKPVMESFQEDPIIASEIEEPALEEPVKESNIDSLKYKVYDREEDNYSIKATNLIVLSTLLGINRSVIKNNLVINRSRKLKNLRYIKSRYAILDNN